MKIISTDATPEQQKKDYKRLLAAHKSAMKTPFWDVFGGVITINGRRYQVVNK